jgi:L,D-transpeptidase catalytic domain
MVDYLPLLSRTVASLDPNTMERRYALYDRARAALVEKLRTSAPAISQVNFREEVAALDAAIRQVEADAVRRGAPSRSKPSRETYEEPVEGYHDRPPLNYIGKRLRITAGAICALIILLASVGAYSYWPRILPEVLSSLKTRSVDRPIEQPSAAPRYFNMRQLVYYRTNYPEGTIVVDKSQTFLYVVRPRLAALRYTIGVGNECAALVGLYHVMRKEEWPGMNAPSQKSVGTADDRLNNPFGARALYLNKDYLIHGTNASPTQRALAGCIGLINDDVTDLYDRTPLESRVVVLN